MVNKRNATNKYEPVAKPIYNNISKSDIMDFIMLNDWPGLKQVLMSGHVDINMKIDNMGNSLLQSALYHRKNKLASELAYYGVDVNLTNSNMENALYNSVRLSYSDVSMTLLVDKMINVNQINMLGNNVLHYAYLCSDYRTIEMIIKRNIDINHKNNETLTPLMMFITKSYDKIINKDIFDILITYSNLNIADKHGTNALMHIFKNYNMIAIPDFFILRIITKTDNLDIADDSDNTPLFYALGIHLSYELFYRLINKTTDFTKRNKQGHTYLTLAIVNKLNADVVKLIINKSNCFDLIQEPSYGSISGSQQYGLSFPLTLAFINNTPKDCINLLIKKVNNFDNYDKRHNKIIYYAIMYYKNYNDENILNIILDSTHDVDTQNIDGYTPVLLSLTKSFFISNAFVTKIVNKATHCDYITNNNNHAINMAIDNEMITQANIVKIINKCTYVDNIYNGHTPLYLAAKYNLGEVVDALIRKNASIYNDNCNVFDISSLCYDTRNALRNHMMDTDYQAKGGITIVFHAQS